MPSFWEQKNRNTIIMKLEASESWFSYIYFLLRIFFLIKPILLSVAIKWTENRWLQVVYFKMKSSKASLKHMIIISELKSLSFIILNCWSQKASWHQHNSSDFHRLPTRVAAVPRRAAVRAGALLLLQCSAARRRARPPLCWRQELPAVAVTGQHRQARTQGWSELVETGNCCGPSQTCRRLKMSHGEFPVMTKSIESMLFQRDFLYIWAHSSLV